jgi:hypothetical protein
MQAGQPLPFDAKAANKYLKETCAVHGTVNIYVSIGKGPGSGELPRPRSGTVTCHVTVCPADCSEAFCSHVDDLLAWWRLVHVACDTAVPPAGLGLPAISLPLAMQ